MVTGARSSRQNLAKKDEMHLALLLLRFHFLRFLLLQILFLFLAGERRMHDRDGPALFAFGVIADIQYADR